MDSAVDERTPFKPDRLGNRVPEAFVERGGLANRLREGRWAACALYQEGHFCLIVFVGINVYMCVWREKERGWEGESAREEINSARKGGIRCTLMHTHGMPVVVGRIDKERKSTRTVISAT